MGIFDSLSGILDSGNHDSILGAVGKPIQQWTDPLSWVTGGKWADWTSTDIPRASNQALSKVMTPFDRVDETINPVRRYVPGVDEIGDVVRDKPASAIGTAVGSIFGGGALLGGLGASGAGGAGAAGGTAGGSGGGLFSGILGGGAGGAGGSGGALGTGLASGGSAAGYGGGVSSSVLPGIFQGASVAPQGAAGIGSFSGGLGGLGAFGGGAGTGSITGAGSGGGLGLNSSGIDWMQLGQQGMKLMNQNQQQQQQRQAQAGAGAGVGGGGGGGGNMRGLFAALMQKPMSVGNMQPTANLINLKGY